MPKYEPFGKIPEFRKPVTITEKLDGISAAVIIEKVRPHSHGYYTVDDNILGSMRAGTDGLYAIYAQAGNRIVNTENDNHGFAAWVKNNASGLISTLGTGRHNGEWWGKGIKRDYWVDSKRFSLFNTKRWSLPLGIPGLGTVPIVAQSDGRYVSSDVNFALDFLRAKGSKAAPGFRNPEGIVIYHSGSDSMYKILLGEAVPKPATSRPVPLDDLMKAYVPYTPRIQVVV